MFRPQLCYPSTPPGFSDEQFFYAFDQTSVPGLTANVGANSFLNDIPLQMESDAPFFCRAIKVAAAAGSVLLIQLKDAYGNYLSNGFVPIDHGYFPTGQAISGSKPVVFEPELICPPGATLYAYLQNPTAAPVAPPRITMVGFKRRPQS